MVSLTAAKTSRIFDVSVACVRLHQTLSRSIRKYRYMKHLLRIQVQMRPVHLVEAPEEILCSSVDIVSSRIIWEVVA
jgi:hypothetical protein